MVFGFLRRTLKERRRKQSCNLTEEKEGALNFQLSHSWILEEIEKYNLSKLSAISYHIFKAYQY